MKKLKTDFLQKRDCIDLPFQLILLICGEYFCFSEDENSIIEYYGRFKKDRFKKIFQIFRSIYLSGFCCIKNIPISKTIFLYFPFCYYGYRVENKFLLKCINLRKLFNVEINKRNIIALNDLNLEYLHICINERVDKFENLNCLRSLKVLHIITSLCLFDMDYIKFPNLEILYLLGLTFKFSKLLFPKLKELTLNHIKCLTPKIMEDISKIDTLEVIEIRLCKFVGINKNNIRLPQNLKKIEVYNDCEGFEKGTFDEVLNDEHILQYSCCSQILICEELQDYFD